MMRTAIAIVMLVLAGLASMPSAAAAECPPPNQTVGAGSCPNGDGGHTNYYCVRGVCIEGERTGCDEPPCNTDELEYCYFGVVYFSWGPGGNSPRAGAGC